MNTEHEFNELLEKMRALPRSIMPKRDLWPGIAAQVRGQMSDGGRQRSDFRRLPSAVYWRAALLAACFVVCSAVGFWTWRESVLRHSWSVASIEGAPRIANNPVPTQSRIYAGQWLETDARSTARIEVGTIGTVTIDPNSRVRLVSTSGSDNRLSLAKGTLHAVISAPPRLFFVETPSATAIDLGCAYTLSTDENGRGLLSVSLGYVALEHGGKEFIVRAGMSCNTRTGFVPGTPYASDATPALRNALDRFDFESPDALSDVLAAARPFADARTLLALVKRAAPERRGGVFDVLARSIPPPQGVTRDGIIAATDPMVDAWFSEIDSRLGNPLMQKVKMLPSKIP